jgi:hypothetical protein
MVALFADTNAHVMGKQWHNLWMEVNYRVGASCDIGL